MSQTAKELVLSSVLTFLTGMLLVLAPSLETLSLESFTDGTLVGLAGAGVRLGLKMTVERLILKAQK